MTKIINKSMRDKWRKEYDRGMISALGEYAPPEFIMLMDYVDVLEDMIVDAHFELHLESSNCPWCGGEISNKERHNESCPWVGLGLVDKHWEELQKALKGIENLPPPKY